MRYITWKLTWVDGYGYGPEQVIADNGGFLEASSWFNPTIEQGTILGYLHGEQPIDLISSWNAIELSQEEALGFARVIDAGVSVNENGVIAGSGPVD